MVVLGDSSDHVVPVTSWMVMLVVVVLRNDFTMGPTAMFEAIFVTTINAWRLRNSSVLENEKPSFPMF